ncbi:unnamed protein product [Brachionus calyciflorus]|uniref:Alpha-1,6-mannosyl-glycoprotein 2-beta-N-acetylglucosaminyltransferase n=1 Tax=Brachionus calyciflorus TaxID=104777 RepID=A0A813M2N1_9BILA|nr:unnamed protein product [Brachionus calyciflorus]
MKFFILKRRRQRCKHLFFSVIIVIFTCYLYLPNLLIGEGVVKHTSVHHRNLTKHVIIKNSFIQSQLSDIISAKNYESTINNYHFIENILQEDHLNDKLKKVSSKSDKKYVYIFRKFFVIVIQVHSRLNYLRELIKSLKEVKYIEQALVIFSHDIYDEEMNQLVKSIDFCATLQIFYPFSLQLYSNKFPGDDPNDCPRAITKEKAKQLKCNNADHPDTFGHYRESKIVQIKHHWFWKLNYIFDKLSLTSRMENLHVLLLEEDHYLFQDSIHIIHQLTDKILSDVDVVSLGYFKGKLQLFDKKEIHLWSKGYWWASSNNIGILVSRKFFEQIKNCSKMFCEYDDYNWDWSLQQVIQKCFKDVVVSLYPTFSRVAHLGECGTHFKSKACDPKVKLGEMKKKYEESKSNFFPRDLNFSGKIFGMRKIKKSNGGWSDPRDHELCKSFVLK